MAKQDHSSLRVVSRVSSVFMIAWYLQLSQVIDCSKEARKHCKSQQQVQTLHDILRIHIREPGHAQAYSK